MGKNRLEAFSDGVLAIIITIMVLEIKIPHGAEWTDLGSLLPVFLSYALSFLFIAIYWGNHHHLLHTVKRVSTGILWSNTGLLFMLSLTPFATGWMGENHFSRNTVITYAVLQTLCGISYYILQKAIQACHKTDEHLAKVYAAQERKGMISVAIYAISIGVAFFNSFISGVLFFAVTALWIVPDKNIEKVMGEHHN